MKNIASFDAPANKALHWTTILVSSIDVSGLGGYETWSSLVTLGRRVELSSMPYTPAIA